MEKSFIEELKHLNDSIVKMGSLCEKSIATATKRLITGDENLKRKAISLQKEIDENADTMFYLATDESCCRYGTNRRAGEGYC